MVDDLRSQVQVLWKTDEVRVHKPSVEDEIRNSLFYFRECLFKAVPRVYRYLEKSVQRTYGKKTDVRLPGLLQFGSWIGGDRDGNPFVKPATTEYAPAPAHARSVARIPAPRRQTAQRTDLLQSPTRTQPGIHRAVSNRTWNAGQVFPANTLTAFRTNPTGANCTSCATGCATTWR